jgi:hypothetical protein
MLVAMTIALHLRKDRSAPQALRRKPSRSARAPKRSGAREDVEVQSFLSLPILIGGGFQWVLAVFVLSAYNLASAGSMLGMISPLWIAPLSYFIVRFIASEPVTAGVLGAFAGGLVGGFFGHEIVRWATRYGFAIGAFFTCTLAVYWASSRRQIGLVRAVAGTVVLIGSLGVFEDVRFFLNPPDDAFKGGAMAVFLVVLAIIEFHAGRMVIENWRQPSMVPERESIACDGRSGTQGLESRHASAETSRDRQP